MDLTTFLNQRIECSPTEVKPFGPDLASGTFVPAVWGLSDLLAAYEWLLHNKKVADGNFASEGNLGGIWPPRPDSQLVFDAYSFVDQAMGDIAVTIAALTKDSSFLTRGLLLSRDVDGADDFTAGSYLAVTPASIEFGRLTAMVMIAKYVYNVMSDFGLADEQPPEVFFAYFSNQVSAICSELEARIASA